MSKEVFEEPSTVVAEDGLVVVDGPDGIAFTMTPTAALETGHRLITRAREALAQDNHK